MEFVRDNELGVYERNIGKLPNIVHELVSDEERYQRYRRNIEKMNLRSGTKDVAEFVRGMNNDKE
jgi:processive 1,2-diacylglycerol beta-glucosyltransferase/1,2-diacylglycerol 3-beta-galactosyltransferase